MVLPRCELVGGPSFQCVQEFREAHLVGITHGGFAIWLDPFGMLGPQVVVNLLPELGVRADLVRQSHRLAKKFNCGAGRFL